MQISHTLVKSSWELRNKSAFAWTVLLIYSPFNTAWDQFPSKWLDSNSYVRGCFWRTQTKMHAFHNMHSFIQVTICPYVCEVLRLELNSSPWTVIGTQIKDLFLPCQIWPCRTLAIETSLGSIEKSLFSVLKQSLSAEAEPSLYTGTSGA